MAAELAKKILRRSPGKKALVIALSGELGAGKTTFTQGFFKGLGIKARAVSPTFIIFRRHKVSGGSFTHVYHMDAYRIKEKSELGPLGFKDILADPENILLVEWPENIEKALPKNTVWIKFSHTKEPSSREVVYKNI